MSDNLINELSPFMHDEMRMPAGLIRTVIDELERLQAQVAELALTLMTRDAELAELVAAVVAWCDAEDEVDMIRGIDLFTAYEALRKMVGR